jgi:hypothetical protein
MNNLQFKIGLQTEGVDYVNFIITGQYSYRIDLISQFFYGNFNDAIYICIVNNINSFNYIKDYGFATSYSFANNIFTAESGNQTLTDPDHTWQYMSINNNLYKIVTINDNSGTITIDLTYFSYQETTTGITMDFVSLYEDVNNLKAGQTLIIPTTDYINRYQTYLRNEIL